MNPENFDDGVTHVAKSFKAEMRQRKEITHTQKLERLKGIEKKYFEAKKEHCDYCSEEEECEICKIEFDKLRKKANKIGKELIGCGKEFGDIHWYANCNMEDDTLCPTCQEIKERVKQINGENHEEYKEDFGRGCGKGSDGLGCSEYYNVPNRYCHKCQAKIDKEDGTTPFKPTKKQ